MTNGVRWSIVLLVLVVAGVIAIWPRGDADEPGTPPATSGSTSPVEPSGADADLAPLRQRAALRPCPRPDPDAPALAGQLVGVTAECLGSPGTVDLGAALAGTPTLLNVWASWCEPCREEMPVIAAYAEQPGSIVVLGVHVQEPVSAGLEFMARAGVRYPSVHVDDQGGEPVRRALRVPPVLPVNYLVYPDGSVERITDPLVFGDADEIRAVVDRLLDQFARSVRLPVPR